MATTTGRQDQRADATLPMSAPIGARSDVVVSRGLLLRVLGYSLCKQFADLAPELCHRH
jgi:hypothetical protein